MAPDLKQSGTMALPTQLQLQIVSADRSLVNEPVDEVEIPGADGYFGVLPGPHAAAGAARVGELWYRQGQEKHYLLIAFGFAEVQPDRVTILAQIAERADEIDLARAEAAKKRAEERLAQPPVDIDAERARIALLKSLIRLQVATRRESARERQLQNRRLQVRICRPFSNPVILQSCNVPNLANCSAIAG